MIHASVITSIFCVNSSKSLLSNSADQLAPEYLRVNHRSHQNTAYRDVPAQISQSHGGLTADPQGKIILALAVFNLAQLTTIKGPSCLSDRS